jgi:hypothetical protein
MNKARVVSTVLQQTTTDSKTKSFVRRWFFTGMSLAMLTVAVAAFIPSIAHPAGRRAPVSLLVATHGAVFFAWLLIFLVQSRLVATQHIAWHRRLGVASIFVFALMVPLAYATTIAMVRRGIDLSGDLSLSIGNDVVHQAVFPLFNTLIFAVLVIMAVAYRGRPEIHKRLMLFANIELMPAPLAHFIGHSPVLAPLPGVIVMIPISIFVFAAVGRDLLVARRIHPLTWGLAILRMVSGFFEAGPIGSSVAWHHLLGWLAG